MLKSCVVCKKFIKNMLTQPFLRLCTFETEEEKKYPKCNLNIPETLTFSKSRLNRKLTKFFRFFATNRCLQSLISDIFS